MAPNRNNWWRSRGQILKQGTDGQQAAILAAGVRRDDLYVDQGSSGARASRPQLDLAFNALEPGDTFVIATLDRLGLSTQNVLAFAADLSLDPPVSLVEPGRRFLI